MSNAAAATGFRIHFVPSKAMKLTADAFHFLHLDDLTKTIFEASHLLVTVDEGTEEERGAALVHDVVCSPGAHQITVAMKSGASPSNALSRYYYGASLGITVPPEGFLDVYYKPSNIVTPLGHNAELSLTPGDLDNHLYVMGGLARPSPLH